MVLLELSIDEFRFFWELSAFAEALAASSFFEPK